MIGLSTLPALFRASTHPLALSHWQLNFLSFFLLHFRFSDPVTGLHPLPVYMLFIGLFVGLEKNCFSGQPPISRGSQQHGEIQVVSVPLSLSARCILPLCLQAMHLAFTRASLVYLYLPPSCCELFCQCACFPVGLGFQKRTRHGHPEMVRCALRDKAMGELQGGD